MDLSDKLLLAFYGDDFTGSTDALEFLNRAGIKTVLFIEPPTSEQLSRYKDLKAIGIAGMTRVMDPGAMEKELSSAFSAIRELGAKHIHYKVCSTFDSSPSIGSIGKAIDVGAAIFSSVFVPLLVAAPPLGRYCAFGNLFARMGIGSNGGIYRLDRHPSMQSHPTTPSDESDLRRHLSRQTLKKIGLVDILQINSSAQKLEEALKKELDQGSQVVLFDAIYENQLLGIGRLIDANASSEKPLFSVGSSGIEMALGEYWKSVGKAQNMDSEYDGAEKVDSILVVSGSCSPVTENQISWAVSRGFKEIILDTVRISKVENIDKLVEKYTLEVIKGLEQGNSVILHTNCKEGNREGEKTFVDRDVKQQKKEVCNAELYGTFLGKVVQKTASRIALKRIVVAGGDTSSYVARAMGIEVVEMIASLSPGAPLCRIYAPNTVVDRLEINFKGGQVGNEDYFEMIREGKFYKS